MRIASFLTYYHPHWTGLTLHAKLVAEGLVSRGHEVEVITSQFLPELQKQETLNGVKVRRLPPLGRVSRGVVTPQLFWRFFEIVKNVDLIHLHSPLMEAAYAALFGRALGKSVVVTHHADLVLPAGLANRVVENLVHWNLHIAGCFSSKLVAYSDDYAQASRFLSPFLHKVQAISPPVSIPKPNAAEVEKLRQELGLEGTKVIGVSGRFVEEKGHDFLLRAIPFLKSKLPKFTIAFVGEYDTIVYEDFFAKQQHLVEAYKEDIQFVGLLRDRQKLSNFYALCDVLAHPSRTECFALVQPEAMLCGTPVVVSDIPGGRVAVKRSGMGKTFPVGNPEALANALCEVLSSPADFSVSREQIVELFSLEKCLDTYEELFVSLTE